jgi:sugar phosphate isomerase/epimerase
MLAACAATALAPFSAAHPLEQKKGLGIASDSYPNRIRAERARGKDGFADPLVFLEHCNQIGAGGVQLPLGVRDSAYCAELRKKLQSYGMYVEGSATLPRDAADADRFAAEVRTAKEVGASVVRSYMLGGRRYETFASAESFHEWGQRVFHWLELAERVVAREHIRLAVENHKDWRIDEMTAILKRIDSKWVGVCVDTGNSISLLEDPYEVVEAYAPWAHSTHLKDMGVAEYEQGFLLAEVPLGEGFLDLKRIVNTLRRARPEVRFNLEMITRDPLKIPCLTPKYWATFESVPGQALARILTMVREHATKNGLPQVSGLSAEQKIALEEKNVRKCLAYARAQLEL